MIRKESGLLVQLIFLSLLSILFSCDSGRQIGRKEVLSLDFDYDKLEAEQWDNFVESTKIVRLEPDDRSLISMISKVKYLHQKLFIFDFNAQVIFVFDDSGEFQFRLDIGPGAENEVTQIYDFDIYQEKIYLLDHHTIKIYDLEGNYLEKVDIPVNFDGEYDRATSFFIANENTYYLWIKNSGYGDRSMQEKSRLWELSSSGKLRDLNVRSVYTGISLGNTFSVSKFGGSLIPYPNKNEVYYISNGQLDKKYVLDFDRLDISEKQSLVSSIDSDLEFYRLFTSGDSKVCGMAHNFIETDEYYFFSNICHSDLRHNFIIKESGQRFFFNHRDGIFPYLVHDISNNQLVSHMTTEEIFNQKQKYEDGDLNDLTENQKMLFKSLEDYTYNDNPIIILAKLKDSVFN